jgi:hypothetical protein
LTGLEGHVATTKFDWINKDEGEDMNQAPDIIWIAYAFHIVPEAAALTISMKGKSGENITFWNFRWNIPVIPIAPQPLGVCDALLFFNSGKNSILMKTHFRVLFSQKIHFCSANILAFLS